MRELLKLSLVLVIICFGAALSLAYVFNLTKEPIAYQQHLKKIRAINAVFPAHADAPGLTMVDIPLCEKEQQCRQFYLIKNNDQVLGTAFELTAGGYGGTISLMVGVDKQQDITGIKIINHAETPGLGANITKETFYTQFSKKNLADTTWKLKKNGGDIDQVSGATISSTAVMKAVYDGLVFYRGNKEKILSARPNKEG